MSVRRGRTLATARLSSNALDREVATGLFEISRDRTLEGAVLVGYALPVGRWHATGQAGVAALRTHRHEAGPCIDAFIFCIPTDGGRQVSPVAVGLPVEVGVHGPVAGAFGIGLRAFTTVNAEETYGGVSLDLRLNPARGKKPGQRRSARSHGRGRPPTGPALSSPRLMASARSRHPPASGRGRQANPVHGPA